jgi:hypothetical protein
MTRSKLDVDHGKPTRPRVREPTSAGLERLAKLEGTLARLVAELDVAASDGVVLPPTLRALLSEADRHQLTALGAHRLGTYRRLVHANLVEAMRAQLPVTSDELGSALPPVVARFLSKAPPRSPVLRDVAFEFVRWVETLEPGIPTLAPWLVSMARLELLEFDCHAAPSVPANVLGPELHPELRVAFDPSCRLGIFDWRVFERFETRDHGAPVHRERHGVLFHRRPTHEVIGSPLDRLDAAVLAELLVLERPLADGVRRAVLAEGVDLTAATLDRVGEFLSRLFEDGRILGARAEDDASHAAPPWPVSWRELARPRA